MLCKSFFRYTLVTVKEPKEIGTATDVITVIV